MYRRPVRSAARVHRQEDRRQRRGVVRLVLARVLERDPEVERLRDPTAGSSDALDPLALRRANDKFTRRFEAVERRVAAQGRSMQESTLDQLDDEWRQVKREDHARDGAP